MALKARKEDKVYEYIPIVERGEEKPFTVSVRPLKPKEYAQTEDYMARINKDESLSFTTGTFNWLVVKKGIVNWKNLIDEDNKEIAPIKSADGTISDESLNLIPADILTEIANVILGITRDPEHIDTYLNSSVEG